LALQVDAGELVVRLGASYPIFLTLFTFLLVVKESKGTMLPAVTTAAAQQLVTGEMKAAVVERAIFVLA
jgi:hypothetical protein